MPKFKMFDGDVELQLDVLVPDEYWVDDRDMDIKAVIQVSKIGWEILLNDCSSFYQKVEGTLRGNRKRALDTLKYYHGKKRNIIKERKFSIKKVENV